MEPTLPVGSVILSRLPQIRRVGDRRDRHLQDRFGRSGDPPDQRCVYRRRWQRELPDQRRQPAQLTRSRATHSGQDYRCLFSPDLLPLVTEVMQMRRKPGGRPGKNYGAVKTVVQMEALSSLECFSGEGKADERVLKDVNLHLGRPQSWAIYGRSPFEIKLLLEIMANIKPYHDGKCILVERGMMRHKRTILSTFSISAAPHALRYRHAGKSHVCHRQMGFSAHASSSSSRCCWAWDWAPSPSPPSGR